MFAANVTVTQRLFIRQDGNSKRLGGKKVNVTKI